MPGGLNSHECDLGELRDADGEPPRQGGTEIPVESLADDDGVPVENGRSVSVEPAAEVSRSETDDPDRGDTEHSCGFDRDSSPDDIESYLRSRHRRRSDRSVTPQGSRDEPSRNRAGRSETHTSTADTVPAELSGSNVSKPYLETLPDAYSAQLEVFEWLDELLSAAGHEATLSALAYYESIGWLSERSREELEDVAAGLSKPDTAGRSLDIDDHRESLTYVARLAHRR